MIELPLFEARHRELAARLAGLESPLAALAARGEAGDVDDAGRDTVALCAANGLLGYAVPRACGGEGLDLRSVCLIREALAAGSGLADSVFAVQGLGACPIALAGDTPVARDYLRGVLDGSVVSAFALTEPEAGSDASAIATRAVRDGDGYVLDGEKIFISNAPIASFFTVFARTAAGTRRAISAFVVDAGTPGLTVGPRQEITAPHPIAALRFDGCRIPASRRLAEEGDGMRLAMATLDFFRTSVGAAACGMAARALRESIARVKGRRQFGSALADFQLTQAALADMSADLDAARLLVYRAAWQKDQGAVRVSRESATAKLVATEAAQRVVDRAVQLHGGLGVLKGSVVERLYREVRAPRIYEGTSEIQKLIIARELLA